MRNKSLDIQQNLDCFILYRQSKQRAGENVRGHRPLQASTELADEEHQQNVAAAAGGARPRPQGEERAEGMPRRRRNMGSRLMAQRRAQQAEEWLEEEEDAEEVPEFQVSGKIGAKKQRKLEEKQARKAQREAEEAEREERRKLESKREEERRREEERIRLEEERQVGMIVFICANTEAALLLGLLLGKLCALQGPQGAAMSRIWSSGLRAAQL
uniref:DDRGK domain-containing protein 1 n=1 Tax=Ficedula albicollis TaxID=59894 RepID=A0A803VGR0_FICAL